MTMTQPPVARVAVERDTYFGTTVDNPYRWMEDLQSAEAQTWLAMKMATRLRAATASDNPVLLRVEYEAGHGMGSTKRQRDEELADTLAFLLARFGV